MIPDNKQPEDFLLHEYEDAQYSVKTDRLDLSFGEIISMYDRGEIVINPDFQRLFRWSLTQQTLFIESILLGIPIPSIFVAEGSDGKWELVDGLQRISTVLAFFGLLKITQEKNLWRLDKGDFIPSLQGYDINNLPLKLKLKIRNRPIRVEIIQYSGKMDIKYELFKRLNTGGAHLTDQEIRNAIFRGISSEFYDLIARLGSNENFIKLISPTQRQIEEKYLDELVLRFISLFYDWNNLNDQMSFFMTDFMKNEVSNHQIDYDYIEELFNNLINLLLKFGSISFRKTNNVFSTSLYDGIMIGISNNYDYYKDKNEEFIKEKITNLKKSSDFSKLMGSASSSPARVKAKIRIALEIFTQNE